VIVLLDSATLASMATAPPGGTLATILTAWRHGVFLVVISDHVLAEVRRTLANPYFSGRLSADDVRLYLRFVADASEHVQIAVEVAGVATHPEDDLVLATAVSGHADYLVTSDRRFRTHVPSYQGVTLLSPAEFVAVLNASASGGS
jgi:putative PIN family toxin of toxin-antitoxin system